VTRLPEVGERMAQPVGVVNEAGDWRNPTSGISRKRTGSNGSSRGERGDGKTLFQRNLAYGYYIRTNCITTTHDSHDPRYHGTD